MSDGCKIRFEPFEPIRIPLLPEPSRNIWGGAFGGAFDLYASTSKGTYRLLGGQWVLQEKVT